MTDQLTEIRKRLDEPRLSAWTWYPISQDDVRFLLRQLEAAESLAASRLGETERFTSLLKRILKWDQLPTLADGPYWMTEIAAQLRAVAAQKLCDYENESEGSFVAFACGLPKGHDGPHRAVAAPLAPQQDEEKKDNAGLLGSMDLGKSSGSSSTSEQR